jgi:cell division protein FtsB
MEKLYKQIGDEVIEFTSEDYAQYKKDADEIEAREITLKAEADKAEADKAAAQAKLEALGLSVDDLKALGL